MNEYLILKLISLVAKIKRGRKKKKKNALERYQAWLTLVDFKEFIKEFNASAK